MFNPVTEPPIIKHNLINEEPVVPVNENPDALEMTFKVADTTMNFEPLKEQSLPKTVETAKEVIGADDHKTDESIEEQLRKSRERIMRLKDLSLKLRNGTIQDMENVPAYRRKEIALQQTTQSDESQVSKFSLIPDKDGNTEIRNNNSFLHDNVD